MQSLYTRDPQLQTAYFSHPGRFTRNCDAVAHTNLEDHLRAALCDGCNGMGESGRAAQFCVEQLMLRMREGQAPVEALRRTMQDYAEARERQVELWQASVSASVLLLQGNYCEWANVGNTRLYHFSQGRLAHTSEDDTPAYRAFVQGEIAYADIRTQATCLQLQAAVGDGKQPDPHSQRILLQEEDALLLCSDGMWQYVFETEMEIDLCKATSPAAWLELLWIRLARRSRLEGDNMSALAVFYRGRSN